MEKMFSGKSVVVTGGANGIGLAAARAFAAEGAKVTILDANEDAARIAAADIDEAMYFATDVTSETSVEHAFNAIAEKHGKIDCLFNNAGINRRSSTFDLLIKDWHDVIEVNMTGLLHCARNAAKHMQGGGAIVNTASVLGLIGGSFPNIGYQATKGAVISMTRVWAAEWAGQGIRVNAIAPSLVRTQFTKALFDKPEFIEKIRAQTPLGRIAEIEDIVGVVLFLAGDSAKMITGHTIPIDGGSLIG